MKLRSLLCLPKYKVSIPYIRVATMSVNKPLNSQVVDEARRLLSVCEHLDFTAIARHDTLAVAQLQQAIQLMRMASNVVAEKLPSDAKSKQVLVEALKADLANTSGAELYPPAELALRNAGFTDRLGHIYNSESPLRIVPFDDVPHRSGLPRFLYVVSPDFAPIAGFHGIFITPTEVYAGILPAVGGGMWKIDERRIYANVSQMEEFVTLLCAGFALP
jgi:hypothetical protein